MGTFQPEVEFISESAYKVPHHFLTIQKAYFDYKQPPKGYITRPKNNVGRGATVLGARWMNDSAYNSTHSKEMLKKAKPYSGKVKGFEDPYNNTK